MNALKKLNGKPYSGFTCLEIGFHTIKNFKIADSKYGILLKAGEKPKSLLVELEDKMVFLPKHFLETLDEDDVAELNSSQENIYLYYGGPTQT